MFRQDYLTVQQTMQTDIGLLRERPRRQLMARTPELARLAVLDASLTASGADRLTYIGGTGDDTAADVKVAGGKVWVSGYNEADLDQVLQVITQDAGEVMGADAVEIGLVFQPTFATSHIAEQRNARARERLERFGFTDSRKRTAFIPIERAKQLIVERGKL